MELKTYRASSMADALAEVKKDLGKDAVILHARTYKAGGVMGVGSRTIVEITASNDPRAPGPRPRSLGSGYTPVMGPRPTEVALSPGVASIPAVARAYGQAGSPAKPAPRTSPSTGPRADAPASFEPFVARRLEQAVLEAPAAPVPPAASASRALTPEHVPPSAPAQTPTTRVRLSPVDDEARRSLESELASIKSLVSEVLDVTRRVGLRGADAGANADRHGPFASVAQVLARQGLAPILIDEVIEGAAQRVGSRPNAAEHRRAALLELASLVPIAPAPIPTPRGRRSAGPRVIALIGPTGVGKTTTIAKLAAEYALRQGLKVGLLAADTYRIAAVDQLKTYASIIDVPLAVSGSPENIPGAIAELGPCDVVLLDTAGRSQRDSERLDELSQTLQAAAPERVHLVLSGNGSEPSVLDAAARFGAMQPHGIIFTKLDEAVHFGMLANVARATGLGISFLTTGQDVPDNIEPASGERIARLILETNPERPG